MKAKELVEMEPDKVKTFREGSDCSSDPTRGKCKIARYVHPESGAIITERDWCTKHGKEKGFY